MQGGAGEEAVGSLVLAPPVSRSALAELSTRCGLLLHTLPAMMDQLCEIMNERNSSSVTLFLPDIWGKKSLCELLLVSLVHIMPAKTPVIQLSSK